MQKKIFISYSHKDSLTAEHIVTYFSRRNYDVWIDKSKLNLDTDWASSIDEAIFKTDYFLGIISSVSVRRPQVIREINLAFDRKKSNPNYKIIFIVLGKVHRNWFANNSKINCENLIKHLETYQYVSLDSKGTITTAIMKQLEAALIGKQIKRYTKDYIKEKSDNEYVYEGANPILKEDIFEENSISCYRCNPDDLSPSAAYLMALDDVWVPDIILKEKNELHDKFIKEGLFNPDVNKYINDCKQDNFFSTLFHNRQIILNINYLFFCGAINKYLFTTKDVANENKAFDKLLKNGSIVVFLYKKDFVNPYIEYDSDKMKEYGKERTIEWNKKCKEFPVYVLREDWYDTKDNHSIQTIKYFSTFAGDPIILEKFALCFGIKNEAKKNKFIKSIKDSEIFFFNKIHDNPNSPYGRTKFYEDFVVKPRTKEDNTVQGCKLEDTHKKPFRREYKKIADFQYNSLFVNHFKCNMILPLEMSEEDIMLEQMFMYHGDETIDTNEVEYVFSEIFTYVDKLLDITDTFNNYIYINKWNLEKITELRAKDSWEEYISLLETIYTNNNERGIDFDEIELLLNRFARCLNEIKEEDKKPVENKDDLAISFRIIIETDMIEIFISRDKKLIKYTNCKKMPYSSRGNVEIYFSVGDIMTRNKDTIFMPLCMFNGKTKTEPKEYFIELVKFFKSNGFNIAKGK